jgi:hypothetical protein
MIDLSVKDPASRSLRVREFYLGRQPILDRNQALFGYELLFRNAPVGPAHIDSELGATAAVMAHASQLGMEKVIGDALGFVNVGADAIMSDIFGFLPREKVVLEVAESMQPTPAVLARMADLAGHGFRFALNDVSGETAHVQAMLPMAEYVKMSVQGTPLDTLVRLAPRFLQDGKKLVAGKVETREEFKHCLELGFDLFQGYYFAKPVIMSGKKLSSSQLAVVELMTLVTSDADNRRRRTRHQARRDPVDQPAAHREHAGGRPAPAHRFAEPGLDRARTPPAAALAADHAVCRARTAATANTPLLMLASTRARCWSCWRSAAPGPAPRGRHRLHGRHHVADGHAVLRADGRPGRADPGQRRSGPCAAAAQRLLRRTAAPGRVDRADGRHGKRHRCPRCADWPCRPTN